MSKIGFLFLAAAALFPFTAPAADRTISFHTVSGDDVALVQQIFSTDNRLNDLMMRDYIRVPQDVRIAKADLDDSGTGEVLLLVKHNGDDACTKAPCEFQIWKQQASGWKRLGTYEMKEENLKFYDETYNGFHEIANSQGVIPWYDN